MATTDPSTSLNSLFNEVYSGYVVSSLGLGAAFTIQTRAQARKAIKRRMNRLHKRWSELQEDLAKLDERDREELAVAALKAQESDLATLKSPPFDEEAYKNHIAAHRKLLLEDSAAREEARREKLFSPITEPLFNISPSTYAAWAKPHTREPKSMSKWEHAYWGGKGEPQTNLHQCCEATCPMTAGGITHADGCAEKKKI